MFTLQLNGDGSYTFTLLEQIDHPAGDGNDNEELVLNLSSAIVARDADGDPITLSRGFTISVEDDVPVAVTGASVAGFVDEDELAGGNADGDGEGQVATGSVAGLVSFGADQPGSFSLNPDTSGLAALTSNGVAVSYAVARQQARQRPPLTNRPASTPWIRIPTATIPGPTRPLGAS
ncbi:hypothetical protein ACG873_00005 (plasmid) [Mesorhizobium sp. AaZ16]|uniref:T1SS-143 repeat domain-containing protein n=1 Tax=Mesorhizobium sp. AaZ16 TaxID=3402289 RepID=UPI00374F51A5